MLTGFMLCPHLGEAMLKFECANLVCVVSRTWRGSVEHAGLVCFVSTTWTGDVEHANLVCVVSRSWRGDGEHANLFCVVVSTTWTGDVEHANLVCVVSTSWRGDVKHAGLVCVVSRSWTGDVECADLVCVVSRSCTGDVEHADLVCVVSSLEQVILNMLTWFVLCPDLGEAMLNVLGCLVPFLEHDLLDSLPYTVASTLATFPPTLHKDTIDLLCSSLLPMTLGQHLQFFVCFYSPIICANLTGTAPAPLNPASLPPATPKTDSAPRPHPQRSTGDVRSLVGYHPVRHSTVAKSFLWCLVMPVLFQHMQDIPYYAPY